MSPLSFDSPLWLLALPLAAVVVRLGLRPAGRGHRPGGGGLRPSLRWAAGLRGAVVALLVLALAGPQWRAAGREVDVAFLVDASDSVSGAAREQASAWVAAAVATKGERDRAALALFGRDARLEYGLRADPPSARPAVVVDGSGTDLSRAARLAQGVLGSDHRRRAVLLTDGRETDGDIAAAARELRDAGIRLDVVTLDAAGGADVLVEEVTAPARVRKGEAYDLRVRVQNTGPDPVPAILVVRADGRQVARRRLNVAPGGSEVAFRRVAGGPGTVRYSAELASGASTVAANDRGAAAVQVAGPPKVLVYARRAGLGADLADALRAAGVPTDLVAADRRALPALDGLLDYDGAVLVDVPAATLGTTGMATLDAYVRDAGRGLVVTGGEESFGMGGYDGTPLEELLPVFARITDPKRRQSVAEALVVDTSGSMAACHCSGPNAGPQVQQGVSKTDIAKEAVAKAVSQLDAQDQLGVLAFNTASEWVVPLQYLPAASIVDDGLARLHPEGDTDIAQGVREAIAGLRDADARLRHIVLFTDGFVSDTSGLLGVAREAADAGITLSVVATGEGPADLQRDLRRMALAGGGRFYPGHDLASIPTIIALELRMAARPIVNEGTFFPAVTGPSPVTDRLDVAPALTGFLATTAKPAASTLLAIGEQRDPLLASWRAGLGTTVAWTSDVAPRWAARWVTWDRFSAFWAGVVKSTFPEREGAELALEATATADGVRVAATVPEPAPAGAQATATVTGPDGRRIQVPLDRTALDRFEVVVPASGGEGVYAVSARLERGREVLARGTATATRSYPLEYSAVAVDRGRLAATVATTGGVLDPQPASAFDPEGLAPGAEARQLWPWLALLALFLAPIDVGLRRLRLERADAARALAWLRGLPGRRAGATRPAAPRDAATDALFAAKARARTSGGPSDRPAGQAGRPRDDTDP